MTLITIKLIPSEGFKKKVRLLHGKNFNRTPRMKRAWWEAAAEYKDWASKRFWRHALGQGSWPKKADNSLPILIDTGTLQKELLPIKRHGKTTFGAQSVTVGFSRRRHPKFKGTVAQLARIHQEGLGRVPARPILVRPPKKTIVKMVQKLSAGMKDLINST